MTGGRGSHASGAWRAVLAGAVVLSASSSLAACQATVLDASALLDAEYLLPEPSGAAVRVRDGKWSQVGDTSRQALTVVDLSVRGDLDGDGVPDAIVLLVYSTGGSGVFHHLAAVLNDRGRPRHASSVALGDRVRVNSVTLADGRVTADLVVQGENDPLCCPTLPIARVFTLTEGRLVEVVDRRGDG
jgi:hypothetical protein